jgi:hypothetical protein
VSIFAWVWWGITWMAMLLPAHLTNLIAYEKAPPAGLWVGLVLVVVPIAVHGLIILYGLCGAMRCLVGHDFSYVIPGNWLESRMRAATK